MRCVGYDTVGYLAMSFKISTANGLIAPQAHGVNPQQQ